MPPFKRKMLILIGAIGVGREAIAKRLIATVNHRQNFKKIRRISSTRSDLGDRVQIPLGRKLRPISITCEARKRSMSLWRSENTSSTDNMTGISTAHA